MDQIQQQPFRRRLLPDILFILVWTSCWLTLHLYFFNLNNTINTSFVNGQRQPTTFPRQFYLFDVAAEISQQFWNHDVWNEKIDAVQMREEIKKMFLHGYESYMENAWPLDTLRPISCGGFNQQGGIGLTMIDSLDSLLTFGLQSELQSAVQFAANNVSLAIDERVHVFEVTIRVLGALIATHVILLNNPNTFPNYDAGLIHVARDLADRLLPAFDTGTGIPLSWINLQTGQIPKDTRVTCAACAGTLLLEFITLSRLQDDPKYEKAARQGITQLYDRRSNLNLIGNTINVDNGKWVRADSGVGAGIDSYYEYQIKTYLAFGEKEDFVRATDAYVAAMKNTKIPGTHRGFSWLVDVHMHTGQLTSSYISSLSAFWPGLQVLVGQYEDAKHLLKNYTTAWQRLGWLPEKWSLGLSHIHTAERGYPLRPEVLESMFLVNTISDDDVYKRAARSVVRQFQGRHRTSCGYASISDIESGALEDTMESFFLSETLKYAHLMFAQDEAGSDLTDYFVLSTEGHLMPVFANEHEFSYKALRPSSGCESLCIQVSIKERLGQVERLQGAFPLLSGSFSPETGDLLQRRRCSLCNAIVDKMEEENRPTKEERAQVMEIELDGQDKMALSRKNRRNAATEKEGTCQAVPDEDKFRTQTEIIANILCQLVRVENSYGCGRVFRLPEETTIANTLPQNSVILEFASISRVIPQGVVVSVSEDGQKIQAFSTTLAEFGPQLDDGVKCLEHYGLLDQIILDEYLFEDDYETLSDVRSRSTKSNEQSIEDICARKMIRGKLVNANPQNACSKLKGDIYQDGVVLAKRGSCSFVHKAIHIEEAGATAMIVVNDYESEMEAIMMTGTYSDPQPTIYSFALTSDAGQQLIKLGENEQEETIVYLVAGNLPSAVEYIDVLGQEIRMLIPESSHEWMEKFIPSIVNDQMKETQFAQRLIQDPKVLGVIFQLMSSDSFNEVLEVDELLLQQQSQCGNDDLLENIFQQCFIDDFYVL